MKPWCVHCDLDESRRRDGLCQACAVYRRKYDRLPSRKVVAARLLRRELRRLELMAWGA